MNEIASRAAKPIAFVTMISHGLTDYARALRAKLPHLAFLQEIDKSLATARAIIDYAERTRAPQPCALHGCTEEGEGGARENSLARERAERF